jgi:ribosomal-protein-alanine N-acetyltransferase
MLIRRATEADIPAMMALERGAVTAAHWSAEQYRTAFSSQAPSRVVLIIEEESGMNGFISGKALDEEWEIENIVVVGLARRRGLATRLLGELLDMGRSQGARTVFLEVRESNLPARRLYQKWAFVESGRRKRYYRDPEEDAIIFRLGFP